MVEPIFSLISPMRYLLFFCFWLFFQPIFSENSFAGIAQTSSPKAHKKHKKKHYNHCPVKRGTDKKLVKGYYYGTASFYHSKFTGRKTSNGERFSPKKMTAAHRSLRLGTYVEVINLSNHQKVYVKINDRLPPRSCRMIDLSRSAASKLHMVHQGLAKVKMRVIPREEGIRKVKEEIMVKKSLAKI